MSIVLSLKWPFLKNDELIRTFFIYIYPTNTTGSTQLPHELIATIITFITHSLILSS